MVLHLAQGKALPAEVLEQVLAKTDGVPLFVEELVKMVLESGLVREEANCYVLTGPLPPLAIPATLQDSLMARLDRLGSAREVAQLGAMLGREFDYELIQAVSLMEEPTLQHELAQLVAAELVYQRGLPPLSSVGFSLMPLWAAVGRHRADRQPSRDSSATVLGVCTPPAGADQDRARPG
jgi:predicted ATPase